MPVRPPSLRAIAAFEAAARRQSLTKAAEELNLTQSAVSHAIRALEERLGFALLDRSGRGVTLTPAGRAFVGRLSLGLSLISEAFEGAQKPDRLRLVVGAPTPLVQGALAPALARFAQVRPEWRLELRCLGGEPDHAGADLVVSSGLETSGGGCATRLADETLVVVAAPALCDADRLRPEQLAALPLIQQSKLPWSLWLEAVRLPGLALQPAMDADDLAAAIALAEAGAGLALAPRLAVRASLAAGRLAQVFPQGAPTRDAWYALWRPQSPRRAAIEELIAWLSARLAGPPERAEAA